MFEKISKQRHQAFKKKHYVALIKSIARFCTEFFGYKVKPYLFESKNEPHTPMCIYRSHIRKNRYAIFYDYNLFKKIFGHLDYEGQRAYTAFLIAHEMRHYYQMRQIDSKAPREDSELLEKWRKDEAIPIAEITNDLEQYEHYKRPMELDAELFAYCFVAKMFDTLVSLSYIDENYINDLENYYIELFQKTDEGLFPRYTENNN